MSFPDAGQAVPSTGTGNIKFSELQSSYLNNEGGGGNEALNNEGGILSLSFFRNATFTSGDDPIPGSGAISIGTDFCGKTFGAEGGSENIRITLTDAYGDGWDDDGDGEVTNNNNLEIRTRPGGTLVFSITNIDHDGDGGDGENEVSYKVVSGTGAGNSAAGVLDITLDPGDYTVKLAFANGSSEYGDYIEDVTFDISVIGGSSLAAHTFTSSDVGSEVEHEENFTVPE